MALSSMTGFARSHGASGPYTFEWELKSVNAKGFDLRLRLPPGWDDLEAPARKRAGELLSRGTVYANLNVKRANAAATEPDSGQTDLSRAGPSRTGSDAGTRADAARWSGRAWSARWSRTAWNAAGHASDFTHPWRAGGAGRAAADVTGGGTAGGVVVAKGAAVVTAAGSAGAGTVCAGV